MANTCTQSALNSLLTDVDSLEGYSNTLKTQQTGFLGLVSAFNLGSLSTPTQVQNDLVNVNTSSIECSPTDIPFATDFKNICMNRHLGNVIGKKDSMNQDMTGNLTDLLSIAEKPLMVGLQALFALFDKFGMPSLINSLDTNIDCITSSQDAWRYTSQIDNINARIDLAIDDLCVDDHGHFDFDKLMTGVNTGLKDNLEAGYEKTQAVIQESNDNLTAKMNSTAEVLPKEYF